MLTMDKAVFFDRDGVINVDSGYVGKIEDFHFIEGVPEALYAIRMKGYRLILVTNQSGIGRGYYSEDDFWELCEDMQESLEYNYALFDAIYFCPHHPEATLESYRCDCECRKPKPGMFLQAKEDLNLNLSASIMIGDHAGDLIAARRAGVKKLLLVGEHIQEEQGKIDNIEVFDDLVAVVKEYKGF